MIVDGHFVHGGAWLLKLFWLAVVATLLDAAVRKRLPWQQLLVVALGWMVSLSWGYPLPSLVGGSLALGTLDILVAGLRGGPRIRLPMPALRAAGTIAAVAVFTVTGLQTEAAHDSAPYADRPQAELTRDLGSFSQALRYVQSTPSVATYLTQLRDCIATHPAAKVGVLPDDAFVYPALGLHDPFPMDWPIPMELVADAPQRMLATVGRLNHDGDYLVLFPTISPAQLTAGEPVPAHVDPGTPHWSVDVVDRQVRDRLTGRKISCGSFVGVWSPR